jgi:chromosome segregation ATPase
MIIGPNGTGKSTIACAIAIGLGFPAKVLGRSTKLSSYPKNDSNEECWIEIELKGKPNEENVVIRRNLRRDSEKSTFSLDGNPATAKEIGEVMENLSVQVGNLW